MHIWNQAERPQALLSQIEGRARTDAAMDAAFEVWINPPAPNPALMEQQRELERLRREGRSRRSEMDQSWIDFANRLRADPAQLRQLNPTSAQGVDRRLLYLWQLLQAATRSRSRYALDSVAPIEPLVGPEIASAVRDGLIQHWRGWTPIRKSARTREERNRMSSLDAMGIAGITMEASANANWANGLTPELAERATVYATLELNGFPKWISDLSSRWPQQVVNVLGGEVIAELDDRTGVMVFWAIWHGRTPEPSQ